jgi:DNA-directed RNA polymerase alpha subunit
MKHLEERMKELTSVITLDTVFNMTILEIQVSDLPLSTRVKNCLANDNIKTLRQLTKVSKCELSRCPNMGAVSLKELTEYLATIGIVLKDKADPVAARDSDVEGIDHAVWRHNADVLAQHGWYHD